MNNVLRAGLYERVSTEEQALKGYSIETQSANLIEYCKENNYRIVGHYTDEGISGAKPPLKRPALNQLLEDVKNGKIDVILFTKLDRWFRSVQEYYKVQEILDNRNVTWKAIMEDYNTATADGRLKVNIMLSVAANERERTSERINAVLEHKWRNKEAAFGGNQTTLGYKKEKDENGIPRLVKDPETEQMMNEFWDMMIKYNNLNKAATYINRAYNLKRPMKSWYYTRDTELYSGYYRGIEGFCEPYINREDWLKITSGKGIKKTQQNKVYLFTGLLKCPKCGKILSSTSKTKKGKIYKSYRCKYSLGDICGYTYYIAEKKTEKYLLDNLEKLINFEIESIEIEKAKPKAKPKTNTAALKERLRKLNVMYMAGGITDNEYMYETSEIKALIAKAESNTPDVEKNIEPLKELLKTDFRALYEVMTDENKRRFWRGIIKEIHVEGNNVKEVIFL